MISGETQPQSYNHLLSDSSRIVYLDTIFVRCVVNSLVMDSRSRVMINLMMFKMCEQYVLQVWPVLPGDESAHAAHTTEWRIILNSIEL